MQPEPAARELLRAADLIRGALNPVALAGNGAVRAGAAPALREFVRATGIPVAETFMGKGLLDPEDPKALGSVGLQAGDYKMAGFEDADVVIAIGYDLVEQSPKTWNPSRDKTIVCIDSLPAEIDEYFVPEVELVGDIYHVLSRLGEESDTKKILSATGLVKLVTAGLAILFTLASIALVANTIRLSIFARRREVEVMKLVGATNWFIRWPFVIEGMIVGLLGGVMAVLLLTIGKDTFVDPLSSRFALLAAPSTIDFKLLILILLGACVTVSALGSGLTLRRFLRV